MNYQKVGASSTVKTLYIITVVLAYHGAGGDLASLKRYNNSVGGPYYAVQIPNDTTTLGLSLVEVIGRVFTTAMTGTSPLHRYVKGINQLLTINWNELGVGRNDWVYDGILCYVYSNPQYSTVPLHRYFNVINFFYQYTTNWTRTNPQLLRYEGIEGYIFAP